MSFDSPIERFDHGDLTISLYYDDDPMNPREFDNLGTMYCQHRNYVLGDEHAEPPTKDDIVLPLFLYDHSGLTMNTTGFHCPWDSGQVGVIYVTKEEVRKEFGVGNITKKVREKVLNILRAEVETYDKFLRGEAYGFTVESDDDGVLDSCWGYDDLDYCRDQALASANYTLENAA